MSRLDEAQDYADKGPSVSRATVGKLTEVVRLLAAADPTASDDYEDPYCTLCDVDMRPGPHADDCPWLMARKLMD